MSENGNVQERLEGIQKQLESLDIQLDYIWKLLEKMAERESILREYRDEKNKVKEKLNEIGKRKEKIEKKIERRDEIVERLKGERESLKHSWGLFYYGLIMSALLGIMGNLFVSTLFVEITFGTLFGMIVGGVGLFITLCEFHRRAEKIWKAE